MNEQNDGGPAWMVFEIGCIECGVSSAVVGFFDTEDEATKIADHLQKTLYWRDGGQNSFEVFNTKAPQDAKFSEAILAAREARHD